MHCLQTGKCRRVGSPGPCEEFPAVVKRLVEKMKRHAERAALEFVRTFHFGSLLHCSSCWQSVVLQKHLFRWTRNCRGSIVYNCWRNVPDITTNYLCFMSYCFSSVCNLINLATRAWGRVSHASQVVALLGCIWMCWFGWSCFSEGVLTVFISCGRSLRWDSRIPRRCSHHCWGIPGHLWSRVWMSRGWKTFRPSTLHLWNCLITDLTASYSNSEVGTTQWIAFKQIDAKLNSCNRPEYFNDFKICLMCILYIYVNM